MGYFCGLHIEVQSARADRKQAIIDALAEWADKDCWDIGPPDKHSIWLEYYKKGNLSYDCWGSLWDGEGRDEVAKAVWEANGEACYVYVVVHALEDCPFEESEYDEDDYDAMMNVIEGEEGQQ